MFKVGDRVRVRTDVTMMPRYQGLTGIVIQFGIGHIRVKFDIGEVNGWVDGLFEKCELQPEQYDNIMDYLKHRLLHNG